MQSHQQEPTMPDRRERRSHPSRSRSGGSGATDLAPVVDLPVGHAPSHGDEDGSLVTEYGLLAVVAATVAGVIIQWASGGALVTLFNALLRQARALVGA